MKPAILRTNSTCTLGLQLREDPEYYIPDCLSAEDGDPERHRAARKHAKHLVRAEGLLYGARNLIDVLIASLEYEIDARAMQADATLRHVGKVLRKVQTRIDRHGRRHTNLFLAYFALKDKADDG